MYESAPKPLVPTPDTDIYNPDRPTWLQTEPKRPFVVAMSHATVGEPRVGEDWRPHRTEAAGNMGRAYSQPHQYELDQARRNQELTDEQKAEMAEAAMDHNVNFIRSVGYDPAKAVVMFPQSRYDQGLGIINVDDEAMLEEDPGSKLAPMQPKQGDFIYTRDPEKILGCRPADCPVITIKGIDSDGKDILAMLHAGWQGLNAGYLEEAIEFLASQGVNVSTLRIYVGASAKKENFPYTNEHNPHGNGSPRFSHEDQDKLFVDVSEKNPETGKYEFAIDMPGFINYILTDPDKIALDPWQVAFDGSDTANLDSGYSSHSRPVSRKTGEVETRDLVFASMGEPDSQKAIEFMSQLQQKDEYLS